MSNKHIIEKLIDEQEQLEEKIKFLEEENKDYEKHIVEQERELQDLRTENTQIHGLEACNHQQKLRIKELEEENKKLKEENEKIGLMLDEERNERDRNERL